MEKLKEKNVKDKRNNSYNCEKELFLDKKLEDFFPKDGRWCNNCFYQSKLVEKRNFPCHIRDDNWLADLILKQYNIDFLEKDTILNYIVTSEKFNKLRHEYEQKIVSWQIDWMRNGGENWIIDEELGENLYLFGTKCDYAFRKGIVDTLLAIGMSIDAIEEGIEKNADKWRENLMRIAFYNLYSVSKFNTNQTLPQPSPEHYEKWLKLRLYEYYIEHKNSVDKYGKILPEMQMTESEVIELKEWLKKSHEERLKQIEEYKKISDFSAINGCNIVIAPEIENLSCSKQNQAQTSNKRKYLIKQLFKKL